MYSPKLYHVVCKHAEMPCLPWHLGAVGKELEGQSRPNTDTLGRVSCFSRVTMEKANQEPVPHSTNILYRISLWFLVMPELPFLPNCNVQPHGQWTRWLLGEYEPMHPQISPCPRGGGCWWDGGDALWPRCGGLGSLSSICREGGYTQR